MDTKPASHLVTHLFPDRNGIVEAVLHEVQLVEVTLQVLH